MTAEIPSQQVLIAHWFLGPCSNSLNHDLDCFFAAALWFATPTDVSLVSESVIFEATIQSSG